MMHELIKIIQAAANNQKAGVKNVLATVVHLDGSSYRKPGVRMLLSENGGRVGAVSGGCVEKEVFLRSKSVFETGLAKMMTYDGRYRLGCEGILYILIEPFEISEDFQNQFKSLLNNRIPANIISYFEKEDHAIGNFGSVLLVNEHESIGFSNYFKPKNTEDLHVFRQRLKAQFRLTIVGGEHDAVKLCTQASFLGWEVEVITSIRDPKSQRDFPDAARVSAESPDTISFDHLDDQSAIVLMTHNYAQDLKYLLKLRNSKASYIGILGSTKRRDQLQNELSEYQEDLSPEFLDQIYSPAGLSLGAETPEEIAVSILSEILSVTRKTVPQSLKRNTGKIHLNFE